MPTPLHLKPPVAAWIVRERRRLHLKPRDVAARLNALGYPDVTEATVKVWESNANRRPGPYNLEGLERLFESKAPEALGAMQTGDALVVALGAQTEAITELVGELRAGRDESRFRSLELAVALLAQRLGVELPERSAPRETVG